MARAECPDDVHLMTNVRVSGFDPITTTSEMIKEIFQEFGSIGDVYIPLKVEGNKGAHGIGRQREFAFIRFKDREAAHDAIFRMNGADFHGRTLKVEDSTQGVYFSQDTGHITNYHLGPEFAEKPEFDSSMPPEHYNVLAHAQRDIEAMHTIRVNNVDVSKMDDEAVHFYFSSFGKIGDIVRPTDLKTRKYRNFMFIRYIRIQDALEAAKQMNCQYIYGIRIQVEFVRKTCYFGQDETTLDPVQVSGFV